MGLVRYTSRQRLPCYQIVSLTSQTKLTISIAAFMGIHLGVEDDAEGNAQLQKAKAKEQTQAEKFHAFREVHSQAWHRRRDDLGQEFLNTFVRQNIAEIDDIPTVEHLHQIKLPASEGAVYLELEHHLQALEMQA